MTAERMDFPITDGVTWAPRIPVLDEDGVAVDPTTYTATWTIKDRFGGTAVRTLTEAAGLAKDFETGDVLPRIEEEDIAALPQRAVYYFHAALSDGTVNELLWGYMPRSPR